MWHIVEHLLRGLLCTLKAALVLSLILISVPLLDTLCHMGLHSCPHTFSFFDPSRIIPVVYGLPTEEMYREAEEGKIALGWCVLGPVSGLCPHCRWTPPVASSPNGWGG